MVSVWLAANREYQVWAEKHRNGDKKEYQGILSISLLRNTGESFCCGNGKLFAVPLCLSLSVSVSVLHNWETPSPPLPSGPKLSRDISSFQCEQKAGCVCTLLFLCSNRGNHESLTDHHLCIFTQVNNTIFTVQFFFCNLARKHFCLK